ncbi:MAG: SGNH/GDSL hydrolase family protein [Proteobacteria bacterium]|nr:SGNH/GDSL hydrolase family protein [Pseudomonadota bacterium]
MGRISSIFNFKKIPWGIAGAGALFLLLELAARMLWTPAFVGEKTYSRFEPNYRYGYSEQMPLFFESIGNQLVCMQTQYTQFHRQTLSKTKAKNEIRIFTLGGSVSRGSLETSYSGRLEKMLRLAAPQYEWHIINLSCGGYGTSRMRVLMKKTLAYEPDLFILHPHGSNEYEDERDFNYQEKLHAGMNRLFFSSHFLVLSKKKYDELNSNALPQSDAESELKASAVPENVARWNATMDKNLQAMMDVAKSRHAGVVLVGRADRNDGAEYYANKETLEINRIIKEHSKTFSPCFYLDMAGLMASTYPDMESKEFLFEDTTHWREIGHKMAAEHLLGPVLAMVKASRP